MVENFRISVMMNSQIFKGFLNEECQHLLNKFQPYVKQYDKGEIVLNDGDVVDDIYMIHSGKLVGMKFYYEGDTHLLRTYEPGEVIAVEAVCSSFKTSPLTFVAGEKSEVMLFSLDIIDDPMERMLKDKLMQNMVHILADDNIKLIYKTEVLSKRALRERIMTYLSIIQGKRGSDCFRIMMNQEQLAQYLCVNRSALSYELNQMKKERIITFEKDLYQILKK